MTTNSTLGARFLTAVFSAALTAASGPALAVEPATTTASAPERAGPLESITTLIGDAECDNQGQCRALAIGAKPCGGPSSYLAWSSKVTDPSALRAAVVADAKTKRQENSDRGLASDCRVSPEPTAVCRPRPSDGKKTCQLGQGGVRSAD